MSRSEVLVDQGSSQGRLHNFGKRRPWRISRRLVLHDAIYAELPARYSEENLRKKPRLYARYIQILALTTPLLLFSLSWLERSLLPIDSGR
jgi:hypothetical protein